MPDWLKSAFRFLVWIVVLLLAAGAVLRFFFVEAIVLGHNGMAPTLFAGDEALLWRDSSPEMGDVVVCAHPQQPGQLVVGRVAGLEGMSLRTVRGILEVNGTRPDRDRRGEVDFTDPTTSSTARMVWGIEKFGNAEHLFFERKGWVFNLREVRVPPGKIFLLGDHRSYVGHDSRAFGPVDRGSCRGSVFLLWSPAPGTPPAIERSRLQWIE
ncbi:MAG: signal peptidase I [Myxococcota bacterium]|nr:signal peptidase I [Myxococcota bacterium]MDW8360903.1 signal peptidase I [Myxococcales bacterium]